MSLRSLAFPVRVDCVRPGLSSSFHHLRPLSTSSHRLVQEGRKSTSSSDLFRTTFAEVDKVAQQDKVLPSRGKAKHTQIKTSVMKLKQVCRQVRGMDVDAALRQLEVNPRFAPFCPPRPDPPPQEGGHGGPQMR